MSTTHVTTFYSFKGGVGRSLLMANVGVLLARGKPGGGRGRRRVLLWDLDLEAPGLHHIPGLAPDGDHASGFLEWLHEWQSTGQKTPPSKAALGRLRRCVLPVRAMDGLSILPAYGRGANFPELYERIEWGRFLVDDPGIGLELLRAVLEHLGQAGEFDHVLIDSRTGVTDIGGFLAALLPHATVLVGSYGRQSSHGLFRIWDALTRTAGGGGATPERNPLRDRPLERLLVASPVPVDAEALEERRAVWREHFRVLPTERLVEVPLDSRLLVSEALLALESERSPVAESYERVADRLSTLRDDLLEELEDERESEALYPEITDDRRKPGDMRLARGKSFEARVARLLSLLDFEVEGEQLVGGNQVDLIAKLPTPLGTTTYLVECKHHARPTPKSDVEKLFAWTQAKEALALGAQAMLVANGFSTAALTFAANLPSVHALTVAELERRLMDLGPYLADLCRTYEGKELARTYVDQRVLLEADPANVEGADLIEHGVEWASGAGTRLWLLLGDYGTGKSAFFQTLAYRLALTAREDADAPIPIAINLADYPGAISLENLLQDHLRRRMGWHGNPEVVLHLLASGRVVLLFDSFDEMGTASSEARSIEDQLRQLARPAGEVGTGPRGNRVLITCRTHFFRDQRQAKRAAEGRVVEVASEDSRLGKLARQFDGTIDELLLFNPDQIREFLGKCLSAEAADEAARFIANTYDLTSLAPRPVLLEMIIKALPSLADAGPRLTPAALYFAYINDWLRDKSGISLKTSVEQRWRILERLAFQLWSEEQHRIHYTRLARLVDELPADLRGGIDPVQVDIELRSAAFLVRTKDGFYGFSHKSFREFFYAAHVQRCVAAGDAAERAERLATALDTAPITPEAVGFLHDRYVDEETGDEELAEAVRAILAAPYRERISENALRLAHRYTFHSLGSQITVDREPLWALIARFVPERAQLAGAELGEEQLHNAWLKDADLRGAHLERVNLDWANLEGADLCEALLQGASMRRLCARKARFEAASLQGSSHFAAQYRGAQFRAADLTVARMDSIDLRGADLSGANLYGARLANADLKEAPVAGANWSKATGPRARGAPSDLQVRVPPVLRAEFQRGHSGAVHSAVFSPDGARVLTACDDGKARMFDAVAGELLRVFEAHGGPIHSAVFSLDGARILVACEDSKARLFEAATGELVRAFESHSGSLNSAVFSPDGERVLTASSDNTARLFQVATGELQRTFKGYGGPINSAVFSPDGARILTACEGDVALLFDATKGDLLCEFGGHVGRVNSAVFSPDGARVLTASDDNVARLFEGATGLLLRAFVESMGPVYSAAFSPDGTHVLTACDFTRALLFDAASGELLREFAGHGSLVASAVFSPDGERVLTGSDDDYARLFEADTGVLLREFEGHAPWVYSAVFSPDGAHILTARDTNTARLFDAATGRLVRLFEGHASPVHSATFSPDGVRVLTTCDDVRVRLFEAATGKLLRAFECEAGPVYSAVFSPDDTRVLTVSGDGKAHLFEVSTGELLRTFEGHASPPHPAVFSPDGACVLMPCGNEEALLFEAATGRLLRTFGGHAGPVTSISLSPDGAYLLTASRDNKARLFETPTGKLVHAFEGHAGVITSAVFSPDGARVLTASIDNKTRLFETATGKLVRTYEGHGSPVYSVVFSPDGTRALRTFRDTSLFISEVETGQAVRTWHVFGDDWLSLDPDGGHAGTIGGIRRLRYTDATDTSNERTFWHAEDLPEMRADAPRTGTAT